MSFCNNSVIARLVGLFLEDHGKHLVSTLESCLGMEDLTKHWSSLSLSEIEGPGLCLRSDQVTTEHGIVARFLTKRPLNIEAISNTFTPLWRSKSGFKVKNIGDHVVLFSFDNKSDVDRILSAEPWSFDKNIMVLSRYDKDITVKASELTKVPFWIQILDIPLCFRHREIAEQICQPLGLILHPNEASEFDGGSFIRVRVLLDISQPLGRGRLITLEDGKNNWVSFKYERLPNLCYWCGCLTHDDRDCATWIDSEGCLNSEDQQFGSWLHASPFSTTRKKVVFVPDFFAKKKTTKSTTPNTAPPPKPPVIVNQAIPSSNSLSSRALNESLGNKEFESVRVSIPTHQGLLEKSMEGLAPISPKPGDFEKTLQDLDREIHRFEKVTEGHLGSNDYFPALDQAHSIHTANLSSPTMKTPTVLLSKPKSLNDRSNMDLDNNNSKPKFEGKRLRIQRPIHSNENNTPEAILGKRSALTPLESSTPSKRRASAGAAQNENFPPLAEVVSQPHRGR